MVSHSNPCKLLNKEAWPVCTLDWPKNALYSQTEKIMLATTFWRSHERRKKIPHESQKAHNIFPVNGGAGVVKINFPMSGEAANGEIYFHHNCCAMNGENIMCLE